MTFYTLFNILLGIYLAGMVLTWFLPEWMLFSSTGWVTFWEKELCPRVEKKPEFQAVSNPETFSRFAWALIWPYLVFAALAIYHWAKLKDWWLSK